MSEWQPIETAPKDGTWVWVYDSAIRKSDETTGKDVAKALPPGCRVGRWASDSGEWEISGLPSTDGHHPTKWHPLPETPEDPITRDEVIEIMAKGIEDICGEQSLKFAENMMSTLEALGLEAIEKKDHLTLTNGKLALISPQDVKRVKAAGNWHSVCKSGNDYACRSFRRGRRTYLHRFILDAPAGYVVDHINGNTLDNRRGNLRLVSHKKNQRNKTTQANNTSGVTGVYWSKLHQQWEVAIGHNGKKIHLGLFKDIEEAAKARLAKEREIWPAEDRHRAEMERRHRAMLAAKE